MSDGDFYGVVADLVLSLHTLFVAFVVFGLLLIIAGGMFQWPWVRNPWFRWVHLAAIGIVVAQVWFGLMCPLTVLENWLRSRAGETGYGDSFIEYWLGKILYYDLPDWIFIVVYTVFGLMVLLSWFMVRPRAFSNR